MDYDYDFTNRDERGLLKDCSIAIVRRKGKCRPEQCPYCGWNPREAERRKVNGRLHRHPDGLWGF